MSGTIGTPRPNALESHTRIGHIIRDLSQRSLIQKEAR